MRLIKMGRTELCGSVHTAQRQMPRQIQIGFCVNLSESAFVSVVISQKIRITLIYKCAHKNLRDKL